METHWAIERENRMEENFDDQVKQLAMLAQNETTLYEFAAEYQRLLEENYNQMVRVENSAKASAGQYSVRGKILQGILNRQVEFVKQLKQSSQYLKVVK